MTDTTLKIVRLKTGEDLIGKATFSTQASGRSKIVLEKVMQIFSRTGPEGNPEYALVPFQFFSTGFERLPLDVLEDTSWVLDPADDCDEFYNNHPLISSIIKPRTPGIIIP